MTVSCWGDPKGFAPEAPTIRTSAVLVLGDLPCVPAPSYLSSGLLGGALQPGRPRPLPRARPTEQLHPYRREQ